MRTTIVLEDTIHTKLKECVPQRKISAFINQLINERLIEAEKKAIAKKMKEGYLHTRSDRKEVEKDWDGILTEGWE